MSDPKKGTGKKPKGSGRRLYTDENPKDTVRIKYATPADARATAAKVKRINKLEGDMYFTNMQLNNTSMKLEMFLDMIEDEMHSSIKRIARPIAREEVIKGFQEFSENLNNLD